MFHKLLTGLVTSALCLGMVLFPAQAEDVPLPEFPETEPNNSVAAANVILENCIIKGSLQDQDTDYYIFNISQEQELPLTVFATSKSADISILAANGTSILASAFNMGYSPNMQSYIKYLSVRLTPGNYYLRISDSFQQSGSYSAALLVTGLQKPDFTVPLQGWVAEDGRWCYYGFDGQKYIDSWIEENGHAYYLDGSGYLITDRWAQISGSWYYLDETGARITGSWIADSTDWCFLNTDGRMRTDGWAADSLGWCYLDGNGHLLRDRWVTDSLDWCYVDSTGHVVTSRWVTDSLGWCYLDETGHLLRDGYARDSVGEHYLDETGHMIW